MDMFLSLVAFLSSLMFPQKILDGNSLIFIGDRYRDYKVLNTTSNLTGIYETKYFWTKLPTAVFFHDWQSGYKCESSKAIAEAFFEQRFNILIAEWGKASNDSYNSVVGSIPNIAYTYIKLLKKLEKEGYDLGKLYLIGHGLGAQICGAIGRHFISNYNLRLERITGLDPTGLNFNQPEAYQIFNLQISKNCDLTLSKGDARFVDIIHTDPGEIGTNLSTGDMDFWPNSDGKMQPACARCIEKNGINSAECRNCDHKMSWRYFAESVESDSPKFMARLCPRNATVFNAKTCNESAKASMGLFANKYNYLGNYFLYTSRRSPYSY